MKSLFVLAAVVINFSLPAQAQKVRKELAFDSNVPASLKTQMIEDMKFMGSIRSTSATPLHQKVFGAVDGASYVDWFNKRVFKVGVNGCGSPTAVACVIPIYANKIWMTKNYTQFSHPQVSRLSVVYHEARHTEAQNGNWSHATCPKPFKNAQGQDMRSIWTGAMLEGQAACDVTPFGSYGSATILLRNIATQCSNCTEKVKADANLYAMDQLQRVIDKGAIAQMKTDFGLSVGKR
jgi:hypothetical protein